MDENSIFKKKNNAEIKSELLVRVNHILNDHTNEIPDPLVALKNPEYYKYKVRGNWFDGALSFIELADKLNYAPPGLFQETERFIKVWKENHNSDPDPTRIIRTTKNEIDTMDNLLKRVKEFIEKK